MSGEYDWGYFTIISPVFITTLLLYVSGLPILEAGAHRRFKSNTKYLDYLQETSILVISKVQYIRLIKLMLYEYSDSDANYFVQKSSCLR
jgi:hypothetical protein